MSQSSRINNRKSIASEGDGLEHQTNELSDLSITEQTFEENATEQDDPMNGQSSQTNRNSKYI